VTSRDAHHVPTQTPPSTLTTISCSSAYSALMHGIALCAPERTRTVALRISKLTSRSTRDLRARARNRARALAIVTSDPGRFCSSRLRNALHSTARCPHHSRASEWNDVGDAFHNTRNARASTPKSDVDSWRDALRWRERQRSARAGLRAETCAQRYSERPITSTVIIILILPMHATSRDEDRRHRHHRATADRRDPAPRDFCSRRPRPNAKPPKGFEPSTCRLRIGCSTS
jgi:hypothetical protein